MLRTSHRNSTGRRNLLAACVTVFSVGVLYTSFDSVPAGENVSVDIDLSTTPIIKLTDTVPLPADVAASVDVVDVSEGDAHIGSKEPAPQTAQTPVDGATLDTHDAIKFCLLMLQDGARFMEHVDDYTVMFHKEERISGDLKKPQVLEMKIQHHPHFAVYMKWKTGERGRQVLYSNEYEDGCMVVKFGGFKKILPALRIDPNCSSAMAETRYPVTEAGILGMIRQIEVHREADLKRKDGVSCVRLDDREFDGHNCYCFMLKYDSPEDSKIYRKSMIMLDSELHIPRIVQNYTWASETDGMTEAEIDAETLIENYSFTGLNLSSKLVALDFSRENPGYRM